MVCKGFVQDHDRISRACPKVRCPSQEVRRHVDGLGGSVSLRLAPRIRKGWLRWRTLRSYLVTSGASRGLKVEMAVSKGSVRPRGKKGKEIGVISLARRQSSISVWAWI